MWACWSRRGWVAGMRRDRGLGCSAVAINANRLATGVLRQAQDGVVRGCQRCEWFCTGVPTLMCHSLALLLDGVSRIDATSIYSILSLTKDARGQPIRIYGDRAASRVRHPPRVPGNPSAPRPTRPRGADLRVLGEAQRKPAAFPATRLRRARQRARTTRPRRFPARNGQATAKLPEPRPAAARLGLTPAALQLRYQFRTKNQDHETQTPKPNQYHSEPITPNPERRTQNLERRTQNAEHRPSNPHTTR